MADKPICQECRWTDGQDAIIEMIPRTPAPPGFDRFVTDIRVTITLVNQETIELTQRYRVAGESIEEAFANLPALKRTGTAAMLAEFERQNKPKVQVASNVPPMIANGLRMSQ